ncbi:YheC/YheD family protein [Paenibacillus sp. R14(2021)]|uniref:YheC/YheD family protein n=1 Tax=Paenibacillus sp. R14(2021) TaxID=2859228 RepID=UPI001C614F72|nr:YheC/YheD family protein [Paenibacillus sp. R14(2021)]
MSKKSYNSSTIRGKNRVCGMLSSNSELKSFVPRTMKLSLANLSSMLTACDSVYIKPNIGSLGIGVCKAARTKKGYMLYVTKYRKQTQTRYASLEKLYRHVRSVSKGKMIVQQTVALAKVNGRPYDLRIMVQRKPRGSWTVTVRFARIAKIGKIVTNYSQGGRIWTVPHLHRARGLSASGSAAIDGRLKRTALRTAKWLSSKKAGMHEMGIDFAFDSKGKLWILEVNSNHPQFHPLKVIDPPTYRLGMSFARTYGRYSAK